MRCLEHRFAFLSSRKSWNHCCSAIESTTRTASKLSGRQGDPVGRGTLIILLIMSAVSWYIIFTKLWDQRRLRQGAKVVEKQFWSSGSLKEAVDRLPKDNDFRAVAEDGLRASAHHEGRLTDRIDLHEWVTMSLQRSVDSVNSKMSNGLAFLATVGSTAPFVGLFGTVWGILKALVNIGVSGQASIDKVAGPVGEALDHDGPRSVRRRSGGHGLQLAAAS